MVQQAIKVAIGIDKQAIRSTDGSATWLAPQYLLEARRFQIQPLGNSLFDGSFGVASFLAALVQVTPQTEFRDLGLGALQSFRQDLITALSTDFFKEIGIGGSVGGGAIVYVLTRVSQFLDEPTLIEDATQVASLITYDIVAADKQFDIISGAAGAIQGLVALHNISPNSEVLEKAILCGDYLLNNRVTSESGYKAWATLDGKLLTGFSHGAAGIAYALLRLYKASGETAFLEAAEEAIAYERSVFIPELGNWPDFRQSFPKDKPVCMCSWCHGAPGIGLARLGGLDILDSPEIRQDIEAAINTTKQQKLTGIDHLCCGNLGRVEFLLTASRKLSRPDLLEDAMQIASQVVARAKQKGHFGYGPILTFHPGFFQGASGIGYELLRLAYPDQLPSVLLWE
jgi:type 2 lantibiotic biosynthesis protein LanM